MCAQTVTGSGQDVNANTLSIPDGIGGTARFTVQLPTLPLTERLPTLILVAGIKTNEETLTRASGQGDNALVAYHYDYDRDTWKSLSIFRRALIVHRMARELPEQMAALVRWVKSQPWADRERVNMVGGSLGAICLPMVLRELQARALELRTSTFAYGGAGRYMLAYLSLRHRSRLLAVAGGVFAWLFMRRVEPARHLPHLRGEFLIVSSPEDELVPRVCSKLFEDLTPEHKTIIHMQGVHVNTKERELLAAVIAIVRQLLTEQNAFNP